MRRIIITVVAISAAIIFAASATAQNRHLTIVHVNDTHSHIEPERGGLYPGMGGVIERAAYMDSLRSVVSKKDLLVLHAGDFSQGTSYFTELKGEIEIDLLNAIGYDCTALGNHEFDNGFDALAARLKRFKGQVLCANYDFSRFEVGRYIKPYTIVKKAGMKIGIIGLLTDVSSVVAVDIARNLTYLDPVVVVNSYAEYLKKEKGCDMVIVLSHLGYREDRDVAAATRNVDLFIGGHSHTELNEIQYVNSLDSVPVPIVQDGSWGIKVGQLDVYRK